MDKRQKYLERAVAERTRELQEACDALKREIAEREQDDDKTLRARRGWEQAFDAISDLTAIVDNDHRIVRVNRAMAERLGMTPEECVGQKCHVLIHGTDEPIPNCPYSFLSSDGREHVVEIYGESLRGHFVAGAYPVKDSDGHVVGSVRTMHDITDRKRAEEALRESEARWRSLTEHSPDYILLLDRDGTILFFNRELPGPTREDVIGTPAFDYMLPEEKEGAKRCLEDVLRTGRPAEYETTYRIADGGFRYFASRIGPVQQDGRIVAFTVSSRDITEQKLAQQSLEASEKKYRTLVEAAQEGIGITDPDENILFANDTFARLLGYEVDELVGRNLREIADDAEYAKFTEETEKRRSGQATKYESVLYTKTGERRYFAISAAPLLDEQGACTSSIGLLVDITDRRRAENALRQSEERFKRAAECASDLIYEWDVSTGRLEWYGDIDGALGYARREIVRTIEAWFALIHPDDAPYVATQIEHHRKSADPIGTEYRIGHKDGTWRYWTDRATAVLNETGQPRKYIGVCTDVTERRLAEEKLRQRESEIAHLGRVHTVGEMATTLAHEINQPLSAISNYVRGIKRRVEKGRIDSDQLGSVLNLISSEVDRVSGIISHMRQFVRKGEPHRASTDLGELTRGVMELLEADVRRSRIDLRMELDSDVPVVLVDPIQIEQVVVNIVRNAIESMSETSDHERILKITTRSSIDTEVEIAVADTGGGLDPGAENCVFDAFYTTKTGGLGMGLSISRSIIEAHGGRIWVAPHLPRGTIVHCTLPLPAEGEPSSDEREAHGLSRG